MHVAKAISSIFYTTYKTLGEVTQGTHEDEQGFQTSPSDQEMHRESSLHEANNPLVTADADNKTHGEALSHESSGQPTEHVEL